MILRIPWENTYNIVIRLNEFCWHAISGFYLLMPFSQSKGVTLSHSSYDFWGNVNIMWTRSSLSYIRKTFLLQALIIRMLIISYAAHEIFRWGLHSFVSEFFGSAMKIDLLRSTVITLLSYFVYPKFIWHQLYYSYVWSCWFYTLSASL